MTYRVALWPFRQFQVPRVTTRLGSRSGRDFGKLWLRERNPKWRGRTKKAVTRPFRFSQQSDERRWRMISYRLNANWATDRLKLSRRKTTDVTDAKGRNDGQYTILTVTPAAISKHGQTFWLSISQCWVLSCTGDFCTGADLYWPEMIVYFMSV